MLNRTQNRIRVHLSASFSEFQKFLVLLFWELSELSASGRVETFNDAIVHLRFQVHVGFVNLRLPLLRRTLATSRCQQQYDRPQLRFTNFSSIVEFRFSMIAATTCCQNWSERPSWIRVFCVRRTSKLRTDFEIWKVRPSGSFSSFQIKKNVKNGMHLIFAAHADIPVLCCSLGTSDFLNHLLRLW